MEITIVVSEH